MMEKAVMTVVNDGVYMTQPDRRTAFHPLPKGCVEIVQKFNDVPGVGRIRLDIEVLEAALKAMKGE